MAKIAICDDNELIRLQLYNIISGYLEKRKIVSEILTFSSGKDLFEKIKTYDVTCLFIDIDLNEELNGIQIVEKLRDIQKTVMIIFVTSYSEFKDKVLSLHTFDYVIKPYKNSEIYKVLDDLFAWMNEGNKENKIKLQFKTIDGIISLYLDEILYFEYKDRRIDIVTKNVKYHMYGKIRDVYKRLKKYDFAVPHISYIVNMNEINAFLKADYRLIMSNDLSIPISQLKLKEFRKNYLDFLKILGGKV